MIPGNHSIHVLDGASARKWRAAVKEVFSGESAVCDLVSTLTHLGSLLSHHPHYHFFVKKLISDKTIE